MGEAKQRATPPRGACRPRKVPGLRSELVAQPATHDVGGHPIAKVDAVRKDVVLRPVTVSVVSLKS